MKARIQLCQDPEEDHEEAAEVADLAEAEASAEDVAVALAAEAADLVEDTTEVLAVIITDRISTGRIFTEAGTLAREAITVAAALVACSR